LPTDSYGNGPLKLGISDTQFSGTLDYFKAFEETGSAHAALDGNNGEAYGTSWYPNTMNPRIGERSHARNSYYEPVMSRPNLHVVLESIVTELVFDDTTQLTAKGVKVINKNGSSTTYYAKKEIILACGVVNTPKLLQNSGIGPKSVLQAAGIPLKLEHDGVGTNFQDHPYTNIQFNISNLPSSPGYGAIETDPAYNASAWEQYLANRTGPLTQTRGNTLAMIPLPVVDPKNYINLSDRVRSFKDHEYLPSIYKDSKKLLKGVRAQRKVLADLFQNDKAAIVEYPIPAAGVYLLVGLEKPVSRGTIMINPTNPQGPPLISYNALSNPVDKSVLAACVRYIRKVWTGPELKKFSPTETSPGTQYQTDDEIMDKSIEMGSVWPTLSHPSGSCAMLPEDMGGCVSDELLFYGVKKLSIIDASIIPLIPSQHIQSTMYAIGEKAADIIKLRR